MSHRQLFTIFLLLLGTAGLIGFIFWVRLPAETFVFEGGYTTPEEENRPNLSGFILMGPPIKTLIFDVDVNTPGIQPLDWNIMRSLEPVGHVWVEIHVDQNGRVQIQNSSHRGAVALLNYVRDIIQTWRYRPYMYGNLRIIVNMATNRLLCENLGLQPTQSIEDDPFVRVIIGRCYYVE